jgi:hypothetical protein
MTRLTTIAMYLWTFAASALLLILYCTLAILEAAGAEPVFASRVMLYMVVVFVLAAIISAELVGRAKTSENPGARVMVGVAVLLTTLLAALSYQVFNTSFDKPTILIRSGNH